jgi:hypothetical protein
MSECQNILENSHIVSGFVSEKQRLASRADVRFGFDSAVSVTGHKILKYTFSVDSVARCYKLGMLGV